VGLALRPPLLLVAGGLGCAPGLVFGIAPALRAARTDVLGTLRDDARSACTR
jgi:hypothetical protein